MHHSIHNPSNSTLRSSTRCTASDDLALTPATVHEAICSSRYLSKRSLTLSFVCPVLHCKLRPAPCFKSTAAQCDGYSGPSGLLLGLASITCIRGELLTLLRRYPNLLYPLTSTWLRNLAPQPGSKPSGLHFNTWSINSTRSRRSPRTPFSILRALTQLISSSGLRHRHLPLATIIDQRNWRSPTLAYSRSVFGSAVHLGTTQFCR
jgi:hypothetical protein